VKKASGCKLFDDRVSDTSLSCSYDDYKHGNSSEKR